MQLLHNRKNKSFIWTENKAILNFDRIKKTEVIFFGNPLLCRQYSEPIFVMLGINLWHWYDVCGDFLWLSGEDSYLLVLKLRCAHNSCKKGHGWSWLTRDVFCNITSGTLSKKKRHYLGNFPNRGGGVFPNPKTFVNLPSIFLYAKFILRC